MNIPNLQPSIRRREYDAYSNEQRAQVVQGWLFLGNTHRQLDEAVLGLDRTASKGYQSMGILHFLGPKKKFRNLFDGLSDTQAVAFLEADPQDFTQIFFFLQGTTNYTQISLLSLRDEESNAVDRSRQGSSESRRQRIANAPQKPKIMRVDSYTYRRNPDIVEVEGTSKSLFYAIVQGDGGDVLNTTIHKSLSDVKEYYEQNGATGSWSWSQSVMSEESGDFAWEMQDTLQILYHDGGGQIGLGDLWSGFLQEVKQLGQEYESPKIDPANFRKKSLAITAYVVAMQNHVPQQR